MFDLRQLQVLSEVARTGTYTAAAEALGYSQPAISYQMRTLERTVGAALVTRSGRGVRLTEVGQTLARHAETVLAALRTAADEVSTLTSTGGGQVRLAAMQSGCVALVPAALGSLRRTHPELEVVVTQTECPVSHQLVLGGEVDLAMMCDLEIGQVDGEGAGPREGQGLLPDPRLLRVPLLSDRRCVLLPADHPLAAAPTVELADLAEERWVLESGRARFLAACRQAGFTPRVAATSDDQLTIHCLVANRIGVAIMNELGVGAHTDPRVVARPLRDWPARRVFALLWPDMAKVTPVAALLQALRATADEYTRRSAGGRVGAR
ncbi:LysR family transcriptional regulator [Kitasatospora sp. NBC_01302]|uniref:LysR family transcriptional regulator n=1 Tax=Kitasatospora sp. NBC_01302 TaxID=2903575 RepID=UPI002E0D16DC|nr:LysR family transcriptional regulator [Kitasatospora sp. NBC_01302]